MKTFQFPLQAVRELRAEEEREKAAALARARESAREAERARKNLERIREAGRRRLHEAHADSGTVGQLQNLTRILEGVDERLEEARRRAEEARRERERRLEEFRAAYRARRTLDRLRDRQLEAWRERRSRLEQKETDEVAVIRHARGDAGPSESNGRETGGAR